MKIEELTPKQSYVSVLVVSDIYPNEKGGATFPLNIIKTDEIINNVEKYEWNIGEIQYRYCIGCVDTVLPVNKIKIIKEIKNRKINNDNGNFQNELQK